MSRDLIFSHHLSGFPTWLSGKESPCSAGDTGDVGSVPRSGRFLGSKNVDHAGGEHTIPGPEQHWLPYEQLDLPPGLGLGQGLLKTGRTAVNSTAVGAGGGGRCGAGRSQLQSSAFLHATQACVHCDSYACMQHKRAGQQTLFPLLLATQETVS